MEYHKCLVAPKTTVKRCRNFSSDTSAFCTVHLKSKIKEFQLYNGCIVKFGKDINDIKSITNITIKKTRVFLQPHTAYIYVYIGNNHDNKFS